MQGTQEVASPSVIRYMPSAQAGVGAGVGESVGAAVGGLVGCMVGDCVGAVVGAGVAHTRSLDAVGAACSNHPLAVSQTVRPSHSRSLLSVGGVRSN
jgi:hypothetical protein